MSNTVRLSPLMRAMIDQMINNLVTKVSMRNPKTKLRLNNLLAKIPRSNRVTKHRINKSLRVDLPDKVKMKILRAKVNNVYLWNEEKQLHRLM